ncbi:hypothetical protein NDU88_001568 [Pleurodeles waltl]|uniref:SCAN box domain-containing protein n=1 Tax=Pleurodeles waltl TaxID=8319 RepID=A0AAV7V8U5_PLEWA|nr:hypothetical protein NDU88_001568 [Pleurodeles waltl]
MEQHLAERVLNAGDKHLLAQNAGGRPFSVQMLPGIVALTLRARKQHPTQRVLSADDKHLLVRNVGWRPCPVQAVANDSPTVVVARTDTATSDPEGEGLPTNLLRLPGSEGQGQQFRALSGIKRRTATRKASDVGELEEPGTAARTKTGNPKQSQGAVDSEEDAGPSTGEPQNDASGEGGTQREFQPHFRRSGPLQVCVTLEKGGRRGYTTLGLHPTETTKEDLFDVIILEQYLEALHASTQNWISQNPELTNGTAIDLACAYHRPPDFRGAQSKPTTSTAPRLGPVKPAHPRAMDPNG